MQRVMDLTAGQGVDVAIEAVGVPATFDICQAILAPGSGVARRTGRFPQLVDSRSSVNRVLSAGSPRFRDLRSSRGARTCIDVVVVLYAIDALGLDPKRAKSLSQDR